jgi:D-glycerate 3-kinase
VAVIAQAGAIRPPAAMDDNQIARFIAHYQRMTCHIANEMPACADLLISLGEQRQILSFEAQD